MDKIKIRSLTNRFLKGAIAGAVGSMAILTPFTAQSLTEIRSWLFILAVSGFIGFITGGLQALDKYLRWEDEPDKQ